ncbi:hypothetical protein NPS01_03870 [Nocardioides psychrotolerans]|uniref:Peptidase_C39 like family protein n=1 Tax=Nocardioides psychrotolerans TaxID=1005945 RepID=A0A1I3BC28_9ACTN|nr:hypothetical protein [Nocardioides psychrotolerans]GEP36724.1 hypothetical protein NPS01_03870 [Nocardioides psychrotolerans]SFH59857.1 hypothetical protein SAMN05216561_10153 [Nocardioides psychrotolerans]
MSEAARDPAQVLGGGLRQPDRRSCGASVLVAARMLAEPAYAAAFTTARSARSATFAREALGLHRRVTGPHDVAGRLQLPWPRAIGTPPWAVARHLTTLSGVPHTIRLTRIGLHEELDEVRAAVGGGHPVALYVGDRWLPRHVVLVVGASAAAWQIYEPASGRVLDVAEEAARTHGLALAGWDVPWFVVRPR